MKDLLEQIEAWTRAETLLDPACRTVVVGLLQPWAQSYLAAKDDEAVPQPAVLPPALPMELRAALSEAATTAPYSAWQLAAWSVRAEALVCEFLATVPNRATAKALLRVHAPAPLWRALQQHLMLADSARRAAWVTFLAVPPTNLVASLSQETNASFERLALDWAQRRPFSLFKAGYERSRPSWGPVASWERTRMSLLLLLSPEAWMNALDQLPLPTLMWDAIHLLMLRDDPALIERMIATAPAAFDAAGSWKGSVAALLISDVVVEQLQATHSAARVAALCLELSPPVEIERTNRAKQHLAALENGELLAWATGLYASLLDHPGNDAVAFELLARLCRAEILGGWNHVPGAWSAKETALAGLVRALVDCKVPVTRLEAWWRRREADESRRREATGSPPDTFTTARPLFVEGLPYLVGAIAVVHACHPAPREACRDDAALLWTWTEDLFLGRDPGIDLLHVWQTQWGFAWLGYLLAAQRRPDEAWRALHRRLAPERRRLAQHAFEPSGRKLHGSYDLGFVAVLALLHWNGAASTAEQLHIHAFYRSLVEKARQMYLTAPLSDRRRSAALLSDCFAPARAVFGQALDEHLVGMLAPLANDPVIVRDICEALVRNMVTDDVLMTIGERLGIDLAVTRELAERLAPGPQRDRSAMP
jgi:hypothetical protein